MHRHGVDFSGADDGGTHKIRVASWPEGGVVQLERTNRAALVRSIRDGALRGESHLWRIDAPGGLPSATLAAHGVEGNWGAAARWARDFGSARAFRNALRSVSRVEPRRETDQELRAPLAPMNLRVFKQTWSFIAEVLLPLHEAGVSIVPMAPTASSVVVCEGCPASLLRIHGWPSHGYKGGGDPPRRRREEFVRRLSERSIPLSSAQCAQAVDDTEGDILDAFILLMDPLPTAVPQQGLVEGWIY